MAEQELENPKKTVEANASTESSAPSLEEKEEEEENKENDDQ